ncbi:hypothetical protein C500_16799 [Natrialba magadii ATCC 43099]|uniref:Uncharacterized protein n=1 Tax=Natrialba magadii (strain ATCC 43099 / DSM 3394 / CCM 3739 / CIP 104546 / IAM 13178 / JCM 8861 / NBRC 102185 / NCIMB 2190 / MS3) TaxID=547559 RepID=L9UMB2_NATMM|nr:hypothetical protein C500_16799 [Natrialba magadii ATCC 43099]
MMHVLMKTVTIQTVLTNGFTKRVMIMDIVYGELVVVFRLRSPVGSDTAVVVRSGLVSNGTVKRMLVF